MKPKRVNGITDTDRIDWLLENVWMYWEVGMTQEKLDCRKSIDTAIRQEKRGN